jgi:hypothetical protein
MNYKHNINLEFIKISMGFQEFMLKIKLVYFMRWDLQRHKIDYGHYILEK